MIPRVVQLVLERHRSQWWNLQRAADPESHGDTSSEGVSSFTSFPEKDNPGLIPGQKGGLIHVAPLAASSDFELHRG
jgi:hypothetical protein